METQFPPPGWYQDPNNTGVLRWWSGQGWTEHTSVSQSLPSQPVQHPVVQHQNPASSYGSQQSLASTPALGNTVRKKGGLSLGLGLGISLAIIIPLVVLIALVIGAISLLGSQMRNDSLPSPRDDYYGDTL